MTNWMITGAGKRRSTKWGGGTSACKTSFKSKVMIKDTQDKVVDFQVIKGEYVWPIVSPGYKIEYNIETGADDTTPASDEFYMLITALNWTYIIGVVNRINQQATEQEKSQWADNPESFDDYVVSQLDPDRLLQIIHSRIENTDTDGEYKGIFVIPETWPSGPINISFIYGYNNAAREADFTKVTHRNVEIAGLTTLAIIIITGVVLCSIGTAGACGLWAILGGGKAFAISGLFAGGLATVGAAITIADWATMIAEIGWLVEEQFARGINAMIGLNKYGCSFPEGGYIHTYNIGFVNEQVDPFLTVDVQAGKVNPVMNPESSSPILTKYTLPIIVVSGGLFIVIYALFSGGDNDG